MAALSVSTTSSVSSISTRSPSTLTHSTMVADSMVNPSTGMVTSVIMTAASLLAGC
ncbi:MAG: hypothetical protein M5U22_22605 [Thermoleophilia bacterium]|nr:hypothetical protein [Thermoleophilia bacterium]